MTLWQGRLGGGMADEVAAFTVSVHFDQALAEDDLEGSRAHVKGLGKAGILTGDEVTVLLGSLDRVGQELAEGTFAFQPGDEDVHTAVERRVTELAGDVGAKLHTGRSPQRPGGDRPAAVDPPGPFRRGRGRPGAPRRAGPAGPGRR